MRIAFFGYGNPELEAHGVRLLNSVSAQLRAQVTVPDPPVAPVGPDFEYQYGLRLFLGRTGMGPLHIAWDTNLLIDYFQHGRALWDHETMPDLVAGHGDELEALQLVLALWVIRDIRFHILMNVLDDARKVLSSSRRAARLQAFLAFTDAIRLVESGEPDVDAEPVKAGETTSYVDWMSAWGVGSLIQAVVGSLGGRGRRCRNRAGLAA